MKISKSKFETLNIIRLFKLHRFQKSFIFLLLLSILIGINILISFLVFRIDFSKGKAHTLSFSSKKILTKLDDIVTIKFYVSSDIPTRLIPFKSDVADFLQEYKRQNTRNITLKILDPKKDTKALNEVKELGISELPIQQLEQDKYQVFNTYFGLAIFYGDKHEVLPQLTDLENLEYNITSSIYKLTKKEVPKIGIVGLPDTVVNPNEDPYSPFKSMFQQQYSVEYLTISGEEVKPIDTTVKTILVFDNNQHTFEETEIKLLKNYLEKGGKIILFVDGVWVTDQLATSAANHNLFTFLSSYGIILEKNLILSPSAELVNFGNNQIQFSIPYPFWFKTNQFNQKPGYFSNIGQLTFPWSSSFTFQRKNNITYEELVYSPKQSWKQNDSFSLNPQQIPQPSTQELKQYLTAVGITLKNKGELIVFSSSRFVDARFLNQNSDNIELVFNMVNEFASGGALSGIRSRAISLYPLPNLANSQKDLFKYGNMFFLPILYGLYGAYRLIRRK